jgi:UDP-glucose 4-epimerase
VHLGNHPNMGRGDARQIYAENCRMNANVLETAVEMGATRLVFASSVQVMGSQPTQLPEYLPLDGEHPARPTNSYALSKEAGEQMLRYLVRSHPIQAVALRFPLLLDMRWVHRLGKASRYKPENSVPESFAVLPYADGARLIANILGSDLPGYRCYFPASPFNVRLEPPQSLISEFYPQVPLRLPLDQISSLADVSRITRDTGWKPMAMESLTALADS